MSVWQRVVAWWLEHRREVSGQMTAGKVLEELNGY